MQFTPSADKNVLLLVKNVYWLIFSSVMDGVCKAPEILNNIIKN